MEELENNSEFWEHLDDTTLHTEQPEIDILSDEYAEIADRFWAEFPGEPIIRMIWTDSNGNFLVNGVYAGCMD
jgi:hypothetical protein